MDLKIRLDGHEVILHYFWTGEGKEILLAFHGFGQTGTAMQPLGEVLSHRFRTCCFDIFYHGQSYWHEAIGPLTKNHWQIILQAFLENEGIDRFSIAAYSMGGKFLLATVESMGSHIDSILLIAPDGIRTSVWYSLASYPIAFRKYFQSMIVKPGRFYGLVRTFRSMGLLEKGLAKFASLQMDTRRKRRRVYYTWVMFRYLRFDKKRIARLIRTHHIHCELYLGRYDKMITRKGMTRLTRHLPECRVHVLESGHNQLIQATAKSLNEKK